MPEITIFTNQTGGCDSNGSATLYPFTVGDETDAWKLVFKDENGDQYTPEGVTMRVGHINGLPNATYSDAFTWVDRADNEHTASITVTNGVPSVTFDADPLGGVIGDSGVYLLRGEQMDGSISSIEIIDKGQPFWLATNKTFRSATVTGDSTRPARVTYTVELDTNVNSGTAAALGEYDYLSYQSGTGYFTSGPTDFSGFTLSPANGATAPTLASNFGNDLENLEDGETVRVNTLDAGDEGLSDEVVSLTGGTTSGTINRAATFVLARARLSSITVNDSGSGYGADPTISFDLEDSVIRNTGAHAGYSYIPPTLDVKTNIPRYEIPFKKDDSGNDVLGAVAISPYSDGKVEGKAQFDHSQLVVRPQTVATASLTKTGSGSTGYWGGTMNPINDYVTERLALRRSMQLDIQIFGDDRMLFQGQLTILDKIA